MVPKNVRPQMVPRYPISLEFAGWIGHTSYFNKDNIGKVADLVNKHID